MRRAPACPLAAALTLAALTIGVRAQGPPPKTIDDGYELVYVPAGSFTMGDTFGDGDARERPARVVDVDAFTSASTRSPSRSGGRFRDDPGYHDPKHWPGGRVMPRDQIPYWSSSRHGRPGTARVNVVSRPRVRPVAGLPAARGRRPSRRIRMRVRPLGALLLTAGLAASLSGTPAARMTVTAADGGAKLTAIGPLAFGPGDVLFAADPQAAAIYAFDLGKGGAPGAADVADLDKKLAAVLGTDATQVTITDLAVHPKTRNVYVSAMRGAGPAAAPALVRLDGAGKLDLIALDGLKFSTVALPNAPVANPGARRDPRAASITDMAFADGRLIVAGLSNEEFSSKLRSVKYPFSTVDPGTSVEIYHGNHGALETRSPVYAFVPYTVGGEKAIVAGYLCTPLVTFPMTSLTGAAPGSKVRGTTIAELGGGNRPIDLVVYSREGKDYLLMSNTSRGVMKIPTATFAGAKGIESKVAEGTAGVPFETLADLKGIEHLDRSGADKVVVLAKAETGIALRTIPLP